MEEDTIDLVDYLRVIWKRKVLIIVGTLVCMVAAALISLRLPETYRVDALINIGKVVISPSPLHSPDTLRRMIMKKALIKGITGQDGSYLAELLLKKDYEVHGIIRRASTFNTSRINHLYTDSHINGVRLFLYYGNIADSTNLIQLIYKLQPDKIYHLAAQSHVRVSDIPEYTADITALGTVRVLEVIKKVGIKTKSYQASSSEMFGKVQSIPQNEETPFYPRSPYALSKVVAYWATINYRESYKIFAGNGIYFSIMNLHAEERHLLSGRLLERLRELSLV